MIKRSHPTFPSDIFVLFEALNASINIGTCEGEMQTVSPAQLMTFDINYKVILDVTLPKFTQDDFFQSYKIMPRALSAYAYTNEAVWLNVDRSTNFTVRSARIVFGGVSETVCHATKTEEFLLGKQLGMNETLQDALKVLQDELQTVPAYEAEVLADVSYRKSLVSSLFYKTILTLLGDAADPIYRSGANAMDYPVHQGNQQFMSDPSTFPLSQPMAKVQAKKQASGEAEYVMTVAEPKGTLYAELLLATVGNCKIDEINPSEALEPPGVVNCFTAKDIPGENCINVFHPDFGEEVFAIEDVLYAGQALGIIVAETPQAAKTAARLVKVTYKDVKPPILNIQDALSAGAFHPEINIIKNTGDAEAAIANSPEKIIGEVEMGDQYHFHMENQMAFCIPTEVGMDVYATTQWPDSVQKAITKITNMKNSGINVKVRRLGGSYGAKVKCPMVSSPCALAAFLLNRPVRLSLSLSANMQMIGKRFPYLVKYEAGVTKEGKLNGLKIDVYQESGCTPYDGAYIGMEFPSWIDNVYKCDNRSYQFRSMKTNKASNTFCRSPGSVPSIFISETIMEHIASQLKMDSLELKKLNMYQKDDVSFRGTPLDDCHIREMTERLENSAKLKQRRIDVETFNKENRWRKRGLGVVPMKFCLTWKFMRFGVMVNIYNGDGTVAISHGGVEVGQGLNTKAMQVCSYKLGVPMDKIVTMPTDTVLSANGMVTAGSVAGEIICHGVLQCCDTLIERIKPVKDQLPPEATWEQIVASCFFKGVDLSAKSWSNPGDDIQKHYTAYTAYGVACSDVELDILTGCRKINRVDLLYDCGKSMNPEIDVGQAEGAFVMGIGYFLMEKSVFDPQTGKNLSDNVWEYHVPTTQDIPMDFRVQLLPNVYNDSGILGSKGIGEPPCTLSCSVLFALKQAIEEARREKGIAEYFQLNAPATVEHAQQLCLNEITDFKIK